MSIALTEQEKKDASWLFAKFIITFVAMKVAIAVSINLLARAMRKK